MRIAGICGGVPASAEVSMMGTWSLHEAQTPRLHQSFSVWQSRMPIAFIGAPEFRAAKLHTLVVGDSRDTTA
ncbi:MAG: hypothetical protein LBJ35_01450 [Spirochaetaceae bacterium]|nr:hypothetical protein [Spirochaetaceae bacterium]